MSARGTTIALWGLPVAALLGAYAWLAADHGTGWVWPVVVHEGGRYTLAETALYWRHFLRELPVAMLYAGAAVAAAAAYGPRATTAPSRAVRASALAAAALRGGGAWLGAVRADGAGIAWYELLQSYLRDDEPPVPGAHWGYHLLSTIGYVAAAVVGAALLQRTIDGTSRPPARRRGLAIIGAAMAALTLVAWPGAAPFADARYLGHQARELVTHVLVTLPLSFAVLAVVNGWGARPGDAAAARIAPDVALAAGVAGVVLAYLATAAIRTGAARTARPVPLSSLVGAHCWEHTLDYALVALLAIAWAPRAGAAR